VKAKEIMTSPVISIDLDATVAQAVQIMLQRRISGLPVVGQGGHLVGIVTEGDLLRRIETGTQRYDRGGLNFLSDQRICEAKFGMLYLWEGEGQ
jgi:CBS domain-containing protein